MNVYKMSSLFFFGFMASVYCLTNVPKSIYDIVINDYKGEAIQMSQYRDNVILIVNYGRPCCRWTRGRVDFLEILANDYKKYPFTVLMVPSNVLNWLQNWQPKEAEALAGRGFRVTEEVRVKGSEKHVLYTFLTEALSGTFGKSIKYNYTMFLVDKKGNVVERYSMKSNHPAITDRIDRLVKSNDNKT
ncbi:glutathione peroxidase homolog BsaA-like [Adelges cooleyi]|uniref:glutathione peroxidase homolog BsaA-like n=1 Tax=Adelges cooleyi TaxID=133065 RepID=UPI00217FC64B|nr:glutathione peroxidase homolog BsaA-like [Adelges cooleyi]